MSDITKTREAVIDLSLIDREGRTVPFIMVSSQNEGKRYDFWEDEIYLERLDTSGASWSEKLKLFKGLLKVILFI